MRRIQRAFPLLAAGLSLAGCLGPMPFAFRGSGAARTAPVASRPDVVVVGRNVVVETPPQALGRIEMTNTTGWDVELTLERVGRPGLTRLGRVKAGDRMLFEHLPADVWIAVQVRSVDGGRVLLLPAFPIRAHETVHWVIGPDDPWSVTH